MERAEAIEVVKKNYPHVSFSGSQFESALRELIPELKESEDERIRKLLVWQVYRNIEDETNDLAGSVYDGIKGHDPDLEESIEDWKKCLAYLERQKEQKPLSTEETELNSIAFLEQMGYTCIPPGANSAEWSEEDEENFKWFDKFFRAESVIAGGRDIPQDKYSWFKSLRPQPQGVYKQIVHSIYEMLKDKDFYALTREHRTSLLNDIRVKCKNADECATILDEPSWKPSKEQMRFLLAVINDPNNAGAESCHLMLQSLYADLQKLL